MEGQDLLEGFAYLGRNFREGADDALAQASPLEFEAEFEVPELLEDEPAMGGRGGGLELVHGGAGGRKVEVAQGLHAGGKAKPLAQWRGQGFFGFGVGLGELGEDGPEHAARPLAGELGAPRGLGAERLVNGHDARHFHAGEFGVLLGVRVQGRADGGFAGQDFELRLHEFEAAVTARTRGLQLAVDGDLLAELEALAQVAAVEPDALYGRLAEPRKAAGDVDAGCGKAEGSFQTWCRCAW